MCKHCRLQHAYTRLLLQALYTVDRVGFESLSRLAVSRALDKYLLHYAEPLAQQLIDNSYSLDKHLGHDERAPCSASLCDAGPWDTAVVIPAYNEPTDSIWSIWKQLERHNCLLILVLNQPDKDGEIECNTQCANSLGQRLSKHWDNGNSELSLLKSSDNTSRGALLLVDCFTEGRTLPASHGVGLARKIGADIVCALYKKNALRSRWIHSTDADISVPPGYLECAKELSDTVSLALLPFTHTTSEEPGLDLAQTLYDFHLNYYVEALSWANSPYAYHSMGSAQIVGIEHYAAVRGYPKRTAGEDFYLLNKLAKTGQVIQLAGPTLQIQTRRSSRTPFGTGAAVSNIATMENPVKDYRFYHPSVFVQLKEVVTSMGAHWRDDAQPAISTEARTILRAMNFEQAVLKARNNSSTQSVFAKHMHNWFDAFRTLKFIHLMRDRFYPSVNLNELTTQLPKSLRPAPTLMDKALKADGKR